MIARIMPIVALALIQVSHAETFSVPIDPSRSSVTATLTLQGVSSADVSPVTGSVTLNLAVVNAPTSVTGIDFSLAPTETLDFFINFGFGSTFSSIVEDLRLFYTNPGTPIGPVPISMGAFSFAGVPASTEGTLTYNATGLVCLAFQNSGLPCTDVDDLTTEPPQSVDFESTVSVTPMRLVEVVTQVDRTQPIDPANPSLGTLRIQGTVRGSIVVPLFPGDANGDCSVNFADVTAILANFGGMPPLGDADNSGSVNFSDVTSVLSNWALSCP